MMQFLQSPTGQAMMKMMGGGGGGEQKPKNAGQGLAQGIGDAGDSLVQASQRRVPQAGANDILSALAQLGIMQRADGGPVAPGQTVSVGERGPELVTASPSGGAQVTPLNTTKAKNKAMSSIVKNRQSSADFERNTPRANLEGEYAGPERGYNAEDNRFHAAIDRENPPSAAQPRTPQEFTTPAPVNRPPAADPVTDAQVAANLDAVFPSRRAAPRKEESFGELVMDHLKAGVIGAISPEWLDQIRQTNRQSRENLARIAIQNPVLLEISPTARDAFEAMTGASADTFLSDGDVSTYNKNSAIAMGANLYVPGDTMPNGQVAPPVLRQMAQAAQARGMGFKIDEKGRFVLDVPAMSKTERDTSVSWARFDELRGKYRAAGLPDTSSDKMAARQTISDLSKLGIVPPKELLDLDMAETKTDIDTHRARLIKRVELDETARSQRQISSERATGEQLGKKTGEALASFETVTVTGADGNPVNVPLDLASAFASTGVPGAISLGTTPSPAQQTQAAMEGKDLVLGRNGELIAIPIGSLPGAIPAAQMIKGPEAFKQVDDINSFIAMVRDPEVLAAFPSEAKFGVANARAAGFAQSYLRQFTDSAKVSAVRGRARMMGFTLARLLGSNSQLSDSERESAQALIQPLIAGTGTQEQIIEGTKLLETMSKALDTRRQRGGLEDVQRVYNAKSSKELAGYMVTLVESGKMTEQEALQVLNRAVADGLPEN